MPNRAITFLLGDESKQNLGSYSVQRTDMGRKVGGHRQAKSTHLKLDVRCAPGPKVLACLNASLVESIRNETFYSRAISGKWHNDDRFFIQTAFTQ